MKKKVNKSILNFLLILLILVLVVYYSLKDDYESIIEQLKSFGLIWLFIGLSLMLLYWLFKALCLYETTKLVQKKITLWSCYKIIVITGFFNGITPFASGGQPGQIYLMSKENIKISTATNISLQNFILYQIVLVSLGISALIYNYIFNVFQNYNLLINLIIIGFISNISVLLILFILSFCKKINTVIINWWVNLLLKLKIAKNEEKLKLNINTTINNFYESAYLLKENKIVFIKGLIYNFLGLICLYSIPFIIFIGFNDFESLNIIESIVTTAYVMVIGAFIPIPGGSGGIEYGFVNLFINFQTNIFVTSTMIIWRFITYYFDLIIGGIMLAFYKKGENR